METTSEQRGKNQERCRRWRVKNAEKERERKRRWRAENIELAKAATKAWKAANKDRVKEKNRVWAGANRTNRKTYDRAWRRRHRAQLNAAAMLHYARRIQRTPRWLKETHKEQIREFYLLARRLAQITGVAHHVDHIIPLRGEEVSGLHVPWNLQILGAAENLRKSNRVLSGGHPDRLLTTAPSL